MYTSLYVYISVCVSLCLYVWVSRVEFRVKSSATRTLPRLWSTRTRECRAKLFPRNLRYDLSRTMRPSSPCHVWLCTVTQPRQNITQFLTSFILFYLFHRPGWTSCFQRLTNKTYFSLCVGRRRPYAIAHLPSPIFRRRRVLWFEKVVHFYKSNSFESYSLPMRIVN